jgi:hypothetical protein
MVMEFNLTAKDKHSLKSLSGDLRDMFSMKRVEDRLEDPDPEYRKVFDATFFKTVEGNYLDEMLNWVGYFTKQLAETESKQSKEELELKAKKLLDAGWLIEQNKNERNS